MIANVPILGVVIGSTLIDAVVASLFLFVVARSRDKTDRPVIDLKRFACASLATLLALIAKGTLLAMVGLHEFGWIHLAYVDLVVLLPAIGASVLMASRVRIGNQPWRHVTRGALLAASATLVMVPIGIDATWIEPFRLRLETTEVRVPAPRAGKGVVRIAVLTDLQTQRVTDYERSAIDLLMAQKPDVILLPGDVFQGTKHDFDATAADLRDLLRRLSAPGGVYLVLGDTDRTGSHLISDVLPYTDVRLLKNEVVHLNFGDRRLTIGGVELQFSSPRAQEVVRELATAEGDDDIRILLAHRPDVALDLPTKSRIDLVVAGHTHGGQIVIPGFGPPMILSQVPRPVGAGGLHTIDGNSIYVSRGVGCEHGQAPRIRFFCPPELSLLEVGRSSAD